MKTNGLRRWTPWVLGAMVVFGSTVRAEMGESGPGDEAAVEKIHGELGLTQEQKDKLKAHRESHRTEMKALHEQIKVKREALKAELDKPNFSESTVKSLQGDVQSLHAKMADLRLSGMTEVRKILTPEQFAKFHEKMKARRQEFQGKRQGMRKEMSEKRQERRDTRKNERMEKRQQGGVEENY